MEKKSLSDTSTVEMIARLADAGMPRFRAAQIRRWFFARKTPYPSQMTDISKSDREKLGKIFPIYHEESGEPTFFPGKLVARSGSATEGAEKILLEWPDGHRVEAVLLRDDRNHRTACVSTQVGCAMGCRFCASAIGGFVRNLTKGEILEQFLQLNRLLPETERLTHAVIMGTGEPTLNLPPLLAALADVTAADGLDLSNRRVTLSTVGLPDGIRQMAALRLPYKLAVSLHAPDDATRSRIIPTNRSTGIGPILAAADEYFRAGGRRVTFEYILIAGVNDSDAAADALARLLDQKTAVVNLIPYNPIPESPFSSPSSARVARFAEILTQRGIAVKTRFRKGEKIDAACGQLRRSFRPDSVPYPSET